MREVVGAEVLVIDKDQSVQKGLARLLAAANLHVTCLDDPASCWDLLDKRFFSVIIVDLDTPHPNAGLDAIAACRQASPTSMVVVLTPRKSFDDAVACLRAGAVDVIMKSPESVEYLESRVKDAVARSLGRRETDLLLSEFRDVHDEFLKRFMSAERRALDLEDRLVGRDPSGDVTAVIRVLVVAPDPDVAQALETANLEGFEFELAQTGGEGLDRVTSSGFNMLLVSNDLVDLPASMIIKSATSQNHEMTVICYSGPGPGGKVSIVSDDSSKQQVIVPDFQDMAPLLTEFTRLRAQFRTRERERRYIREFRQRHYDFLRKYVALKNRIDSILKGG